jgi:SNF2 family DNA or RNA helicase
MGWSFKINSSYINYRLNDGTTKTLRREVSYRHGRMQETKCPEWDDYYRKVQACSLELTALPETRAYESAKSRYDSLKLELNEARDEYNDRGFHDESDRKNLLLKFAKLLYEPRLDFEAASQYLSRAGCNPVFLGVVKIDEPDVRVLNILKEPTELLIPILTDSSITIDDDDDNEAVQPGAEYYLFGTSELFCPDRNDCTPMDFSPTSTRTAQRDLMSMLRRDGRNSAFEVFKPVIPSSVVLRGTTDETLSDIVKCFNLSELVRDCHYPIQDQPLAETPKRLSENGLVLRDYQKASLQWLMDKECNPTGIGSSGELWARMRGLEVDDGYFYCELTGSLVKEIFNYNADVVQKDASKLGGDTFPSSAILGSEMGLGKTVMALSLVVANPPKLENRVLPREYVANISHRAYLPPPSVAEIVSSRNIHTYLSNATLVVAPMTLCPQWASEIARFSPWMSFITLHNDETESAAEIASKDMVIVSTFIMSQPTGKQGTIMNKLRAIHFHRIFLDESHYNNTGERVKLSLAQLSSTHRYCVTGTPVGHSLADLYGQLRFLRVPEFCRPDFWEQNVSSPYSDRNCHALNVLRSFLSHMVIRHSKEQTLYNGDALVSLPPRNVETLLIPFGSEAERNIYKYIELRNTHRFTELRADSPASVLSKFMDLQGMMSSARMACAHASLVNLDALHNLNERLELERRQKKENLLRVQLGKEMWVEEKKKKTKSTTRAEVFHEAIANALPSAQARMRDIVLLFHEGEMEHAECPVCLEATGEKDIALTPCAHMFCAECILSCLHTLSRTREPTGKCPECREAIKKSELTFLGQAEDAGKPPTEDQNPEAKKESTGSTFDINGFSFSKKDTVAAAEDQKPEAKKESTGSTFDINGFSFSTKDTVAAASSGAGNRRVLYQPLTDLEKRQQRVICHTLPPEFLTAWNDGFHAIGTKVACLLEEIKSMSQKDPTAKAVVFSQYLGTLDVAGQEMTAKGIKFARVDGTMQQHQRADSIQSFTHDQQTVVLLLSMRGKHFGELLYRQVNDYLGPDDIFISTLFCSWRSRTESDDCQSLLPDGPSDELCSGRTSH